MKPYELDKRGKRNQLIFSNIILLIIIGISFDIENPIIIYIAWIFQVNYIIVKICFSKKASTSSWHYYKELFTSLFIFLALFFLFKDI